MSELELNNPTKMWKRNLSVFMISFFFGIFWAVLQVVFEVIGYFWLGEIAITAMMFTYLLFFAMNKLMKQKTGQYSDYGFVFGTIEMVFGIGYGYLSLLISLIFMAALPEKFSPVAQYLPTFLLPPKSNLENFVNGGGFSFSSWLPQIIIYFFLGLTMVFLSFFIVLWVRKFVVRDSRAVFPIAEAASILISSFERGNKKVLRYVLLGVLVGYFLQAFRTGHILWFMAPGFPTLPEYLDLSSYLQKYLPGASLMFDLRVPVFAFSYFIPLNVQISTFIFSVIAYLMLSPLGVKQGMIPWEQGRTGLFYQLSAGRTGFYFLYQVIGGLIAVSCIPLVIKWSEMKKTSKTENKRLRGGKDKILPQNYLFIGLLTLFLVSVVLLTLLNVSFYVSLFIVLANVLFAIANIWVFSSSNLFIPTRWMVTRSLFNFFFPTHEINKETVGSVVASHVVGETVQPVSVTGMETFKLAFKGKMEGRKMLIAQILGVTIALAVTLTFTIWLSSTIGTFTRIFPLQSTAQRIPLGIIGLFKDKLKVENWSSVGVGFIVSTLLFYLDKLYPFLELSPYGFILGLFFGTSYGFLFFLTGLFKVATKKYKEKVLPFMIGLGIGSILEIIVFLFSWVVFNLGYSSSTVPGVASIVIAAALIYVIVFSLRE